jgi:hypothetical protein
MVEACFHKGRTALKSFFPQWTRKKSPSSG